MGIVIPVKYQNPHATEGLTLGLEVIENTPAEELEGNTRHNASLYDSWLTAKDEHNGTAVLIGGGASINDHVKDIQKLQSDGAIVFAMNGASKWARENGIFPDFQIILDAKEETSELVDLEAGHRFLASQCNPKTTDAGGDFTLWHLYRPDIEDLLPPERVEKGGYVLVGGDSSVGICGMCLAYTQGYRDFHVFGYDTSHRDGNSHAYKQWMNNTMPTVQAEWAGKEYTLSIALKEQTGNFMAYTHELKKGGCTFKVYGDGLTQAVYNTDAANLSLREIYQLMWMFPDYGDRSPGARIADFYLEKFNPQGTIIDFGSGSGRASIRFEERGRDPILVDFADNCRIKEAEHLPFLVHDLAEEIPLNETFGFCADVMEHVPTDQVDIVIKNIMSAAEKVFFQISTSDCNWGQRIGVNLHITIKPHQWWLDLFERLGFTVSFGQDIVAASVFYVER